MATCQELIDLARVPLNDASKERYSDESLLAHLKDGLREAAVIRPDLFATRGTVTCIAGPEQRVPDGAWFLVDILHNHLNEECYQADYESFRAFVPGWRSATPAAPTTWMRYPVKGPDNRFLVHPPARAGDTLEAIYAVCDVDDLDFDDDIPLDVVYHPALQFYITARAEAVDDQHTVTQRAAALRNDFAAMLAIGGKTEEPTK